MFFNRAIRLYPLKLCILTLRIFLFIFLIGCGGDTNTDPQITCSSDNGIGFNCNFLNANLDTALNYLNLADVKTKNIYDALQLSDPINAFSIFVFAPDDLLFLIKKDAELGMAVHETTHLINQLAHCCNPSGKTKYLFFSKFYILDRDFSETASVKIISETINPQLKQDRYYSLYVENAPDGNRFQILLDELTAYIAESWFRYNFQNSGLPTVTNDYRFLGFNTTGVQVFMLYLEYYLKASRLNHKDTYLKISSSSQSLYFIQTLWSKAEELLINTSATIYNGGYLDFIYSDTLLLELDQLGIKHQARSIWLR